MSNPISSPQEKDLLDKIFLLWENTSTWFGKLVAIKETDSIFITIMKLFLRLVGVLIMIALSPVLLLGLFIAFTVVL